jgi:hypothetical protein
VSEKWTVQDNDLTGGWIITDHPYPLSLLDRNVAVVIGGTFNRPIAHRIADLLNFFGVEKPE